MTPSRRIRDLLVMLRATREVIVLDEQHEAPCIVRMVDPELDDIDGYVPRCIVAGRRVGQSAYTVYDRHGNEHDVTTATMAMVTNEEGDETGPYRVAEMISDGAGEIALVLELQ